MRIRPGWVRISHHRRQAQDGVVRHYQLMTVDTVFIIESGPGSGHSDRWTRRSPAPATKVRNVRNVYCDDPFGDA